MNAVFFVLLLKQLI